MKIHGRQNQIRKKNKMTEKKAKKTLQVRDLEPTKDVFGGNRRHRASGRQAFGLNEREGLMQARRNGNGIFLLPV